MVMKSSPKWLLLQLLILFLYAIVNGRESSNLLFKGAIIRGDTTRKALALVFTGGDFNDGGWQIQKVLKQFQVSASFFFTGDFYRHPHNKDLIRTLIQDGHYLGAHSDQHLLYCAWEKRDSLLVTKREFVVDLQNNYQEMAKYNIAPHQAIYFMPPYEWYNDSVAVWAKELGFQLINYTPGTISHTDYTLPSAKNYRSTAEIYQSIIAYENRYPSGLNGFILLLHIGTHPERTDKFYYRLPELITYLKSKGYSLERIDQLLNHK